MNNYMSNSDKIKSPITSSINKQRHQPLSGVGGLTTKSSYLKYLKYLKYFNKQIFFPLTPVHLHRNDSLLNKTSLVYLNSVHPTKLRLNLNEAPSTRLKGLRSVPTKSSDVIYGYLKSFSKYSDRKKGLLIKNHQHIAYNFINNINIKKEREKVALIKKYLKYLQLQKLKLKLKIKIKKIQSTKGVQTIATAPGATENITKNKIGLLPFAQDLPSVGLPTPVLPSLQPTPERGLLLSIATNSQQGEPGKPEVKVSAESGGNKDINYLLKKPFLDLDLYPDSTENKPLAPIVNTSRTVEPNDPLNVYTEIQQDLQQKLTRVNNWRIKPGTVLQGNQIIKYSYKLLYYFFKSMYCLINKPVFHITPDKVVIQIRYFLIIPKFKVFKWYSIFTNKLIRQRREALIKQKKEIKQRKRKGKFKLHSDANLAQGLNHNENLSSNHPVKSDSPKYMKHKVKWKVARTLIRLNKKRSLVQTTIFSLYKYNLFKVFPLKFKLICEILSEKFKKKVELQLIRIHRPYQDSNILVNLLSLNIKNKKFKPNVQIGKLLKKRVEKFVKNVSDPQNKSVNSIPTYFSGMSIRIGGRLMGEFLIPKKTKRKFERGASSIGKVNYLDTASITNKNRKGSYTLKISSGQNFF